MCSPDTGGGAALTAGNTEEDARAVVERLYAIHASRLVALARTLTGGLDSGDDLVQDVFLRVMRESLDSDRTAAAPRAPGV
jgi:DNA-directed RNA polymerase specialized sigma24 family protein